MGAKVAIRQKERKLRLAVVQYVKSQLSYWKQVPYWALLADRDQPLEQFCFLAYGLKRHQIISDLYVDLTTGVFVGREGKKASDTDILLASRETEKLDARNLIAKFKIMAKRPKNLWMDESFLEEMIRKHKIEKPK